MSVSFLPQVFDYGYPPGPEEGCAVFQFPSLRNAEIFFQCDKRFRQPDFPPPQGHAEIFAISLQSDPNTMQSELRSCAVLSSVFLSLSLSLVLLVYFSPCRQKVGMCLSW